MPNLNTARFSLTGMGTVRTFGDRLREQVLSVKDFGATGDGSTDDTVAIQAAFDYAFGPPEDPNSEAGAGNNWVIRFPRGLYKVSGILRLTDVHGGTLVGAGSHQSRIFWSGPEAEGQYGVSSLLECISCWSIHIEGLTLDAGGVQDNAMWCTENAADINMRDDGSDGYYRDVHWANATVNGVLMGHGSETYQAMGSERTYVKCKFTNCDYGIRLVTANALNHEFYSCYFANCLQGITTTGTGGSVVASGCYFEGNTQVDIHFQQNCTLVRNCYSTSQHFVSTAGVIIGCTHVNGSEGSFWASDDPPSYMITDTGAGMLIGNHSTNGVVILKANPPVGINLMGNLFENPDYMDATIAYGAIYGTRAFVDDEQVSP